MSCCCFFSAVRRHHCTFPTTLEGGDVKGTTHSVCIKQLSCRVLRGVRLLMCCDCHIIKLSYQVHMALRPEHFWWQWIGQCIECRQFRPALRVVWRNFGRERTKTVVFGYQWSKTKKFFTKWVIVSVERKVRFLNCTISQMFWIRGHFRLGFCNQSRGPWSETTMWSVQSMHIFQRAPTHVSRVQNSQRWPIFGSSSDKPRTQTSCQRRMLGALPDCYFNSQIFRKPVKHLTTPGFHEHWYH